MATTQQILPSIHPVSIKLDRTNYSFWKTQGFTTPRAYRFEDGILQNYAPPQFTEGDSQNFDYLIWHHRDKFIFGWILTAISPSVIGNSGQCTTFAQIWNTSETHSTLNQELNMQALVSTPDAKEGGNPSIDDYVLKFKVFLISSSVLVRSTNQN